MRKKIDTPEEEVRKAAEGCTTIRQVAEKLGVGYTTAWTLLKKYNIKLEKNWKWDANKMDKDKVIDGILAFGSVRAYANHLGCHHSSVLDYLERNGIKIRDILSRVQDTIAPQLDDKVINVDSTGGVMIQADHHCPFLDVKWHVRGLLYAEKYGIKKLVIAGDFLDFDRLSWWAKEANSTDVTVTLEEELSFAELVMKELLETFEHIYIIGGNHWNRLLRHVTYTVENTRLMRLIGVMNNDKITFSDIHNWLLIDEKVRVTHPRGARKADGTLARDLSIKYPGQWLVVAHRHRGFSGFTPSGQPMIEIGMMADAKRIRYSCTTDNTYYVACNGFAVYNKGVLKNLFEYNYEWEELENEVV